VYEKPVIEAVAFEVKADKLLMSTNAD